GEQIFARRTAALVGESCEIGAHLVEQTPELAHPFGCRRREQAVTETGDGLIRPLLELLAIRGRYADDFGNDDDRQRIGQCLHEVDLTLFQRAIEELVCDLVDTRLEAADDARRKRLTDQAA